MSFAHSTGKLSTQCPYCEHLSPEGSKFCNECGAALHLRPCAHCGALNDVTLADACGRCGEPFACTNAQPESIPDAAEQVWVEADAPAQLPAQQFDAPGPRDHEPSLSSLTPAPSPQIRWRVAAAVLVLIVGTGAVFLFSRQPAESVSVDGAATAAQPLASVPAIEVADKKALGTPDVTNERSGAQPGGSGNGNANSSLALDTSTQPAVPLSASPPADSVEAVAPTAASAPVPRRRPGLASSNAAAPSINLPSRAALPSAPTSAGPIDAMGMGSNGRTSYPSATPKPAKIGACTEAVAALGLCSSTEVSTQR